MDSEISPAEELQPPKDEAESDSDSENGIESEMRGVNESSGSLEEEIDTKEKSTEAILQETLSSYISNPKAVEALVNHEPSSPAELHPTTIFKELVTKVSYLWFELFKALGVEHRSLEGIRQLHPFDPNICFFEACAEWLRGGRVGCSPSWTSLVHALRQDLLEAKLADSVAEKHFNVHELDDYRKATRSVINDPPPPGFEEDETEFSKLLLEITDQLGPDSFSELCHFLKTLCCPDSSHYIDQSYLKDQRSPEGLLIPLLYSNLLVSHDLDLLIVILRGLGREDLMPLLQDYSSKLVVCFPIFRPIQDQERFFSLLVELQPRATELDLEGVCYIKQEICDVLGVTSAPYLLQFLGWRKSPIVVQFQVHMSLVDRVKEAVQTPSGNLENFTRFEMDVKGSLFKFDLRKLKHR